MLIENCHSHGIFRGSKFIQSIKERSEFPAAAHAILHSMCTCESRGGSHDEEDMECVCHLNDLNCKFEWQGFNDFSTQCLSL